MKKHELIKMAYDKYPKGTKFIGSLKKEFVSTGEFSFPEELNACGDVNICAVPHGNVYLNGKWAEIVKPKIAVKVENEKEFKSLMKHYESLGYKSKNGEEKSYSKVHNTLEFEKRFTAFNDEFYLGKDNYQIIPFSEFAVEHNIKFPLLTSEYGVDLFEGDDSAWITNTGGWKYRYQNTIQWAHPDLLKDNTGSWKIFSTKQSALDWIEAQKPKIELECNQGFIAMVDKDFIEWKEEVPRKITRETICRIHKAFLELN